MNNDEKKPPQPPQDPWEQHEFEQLLRLSKLTMAEKLQWLEDAHRRVLNMQPKPPTPNPPPEKSL